ncbi:MAG: hypothetical protein WDN28_10865 [Chthoniobacter sp.]
MAEDIEWPEWRAPLLDKFGDQLKDIHSKLEKSPNSPILLSQHGDLFLFLGAYSGAVSDFEKMIALDPTQDAPFWRLGIAYYFAGEFEKAKRQFEKYHAYDATIARTASGNSSPRKRSMAWKGRAAEMLTYKEFDREPFPALYEMFAGKRTPDDVLADMEARGLTKDPVVAFDGYYYTGLGEARLGHRLRAIELLRKAVDIMPGPDTVYMWNVARLHWERLLKEKPTLP